MAADDEGKLLPTPQTVNRKSARAMRSSAADGGNGRRSGGGQSSPPGLEQVVEKLLPTPTMMDGTRAGVELDPEHWERKRQEKAAQGINLHFHLSVAMPKLASEQPGATSASSAASEVLTSPSKPSSDTSQQPSSSGTSPVSESFPDIGLESQSSETSGSSEPLLLPTPAVNDMGANKTVEWWDEWAARQKAADGRPAPHGKSLSIKAQRLAGQPLLPTPTQTDGRRGRDDPETWERRRARKAAEGINLQQGLTVTAAMLARDGTPEPLIPTPTVQQGRNRTSGRQDGSQHHDGVTLNDWVWEITGRASTLSAGASPAKTSPRPESAADSRAIDQASSTSSLVSSLNWNPDTSCWRTSGDSSPQQELIPTSEGRRWPRSRERWPTSGSLVSTGSCWELRTWALPTAATASSSSLPTPTANEDSYRIGGNSQQSKSLSGMAKRGELGVLPTPSAWLGRRPENATADPERARSRRHPGAKGKRSVELPEALASIGEPTNSPSEGGKE